MSQPRTHGVKTIVVDLKNGKDEYKIVVGCNSAESYIYRNMELLSGIESVNLLIDTNQTPKLTIVMNTRGR